MPLLTTMMAKKGTSSPAALASKRLVDDLSDDTKVLLRVKVVVVEIDLVHQVVVIVVVVFVFFFFFFFGFCTTTKRGVIMWYSMRSMMTIEKKTMEKHSKPFF